MSYRNPYHRENSNGESPTQGLTPEQWGDSQNLFRPVRNCGPNCFESEDVIQILVWYIHLHLVETGEWIDPEVALPSLEEAIRKCHD